MPNDFEHFLCEKIAKQPGTNLKIVMDPAAADAILAVHPWCRIRSVVGTLPAGAAVQAQTSGSRFTMSVALLDASEAVVLWPAGMESYGVSFFATPARAEELIRHLGGPRDAAGRLVADLAEALEASNC